MIERRKFRIHFPASSGRTFPRIREQVVEAGCRETSSQVLSDLRGTSVTMQVEGETKGLEDIDSWIYLGVLGTPKPTP